MRMHAFTNEDETSRTAERMTSNGSRFIVVSLYLETTLVEAKLGPKCYNVSYKGVIIGRQGSCASRSPLRLLKIFVPYSTQLDHCGNYP